MGKYKKILYICVCVFIYMYIYIKILQVRRYAAETMNQNTLGLDMREFSKDVMNNNNKKYIYQHGMKLN